MNQFHYHHFPLPPPPPLPQDIMHADRCSARVVPVAFEVDSPAHTLPKGKHLIRTLTVALTVTLTPTLTLTVTLTQTLTLTVKP